MLTPTDVICDSAYVSNGFSFSESQAAACQGTEVHDTVHGTFHLGPICSLAEGTTPVQRLRYLKQLGSTYLGPFQSAVHTRHEHSLGTAHLAGRCMLQLADADHDLRAIDVELTSLAGLCHDLGHGPFSHSFDAFLDASVGPQHNWRHEGMSCRLLELVLSEAQLDLDSQQLQHVQDSIDNGPHRPLRQPLEPDQIWRLQVVGNAVNSFDMDKVDYICRDVIMTGMQQQLDCSHFIPLATQHCKVLSGQICFEQQQQQHVAALYDVRAALHERVYQHPMAKAAQLMIADALAAAEPVLQVASKLDDPQEFLTLDDTIVHQVRAAARRKDAQPCQRSAGAILQRLQQPGSMYFMAAEAELQDRHYQQRYEGHTHGHHTASSRLTVDDLVRCQDAAAAVRLTAADLRLYFYSIDYCFGNEDPLDRIFLFDASSSCISRKASDGLDRSHKIFLSSRVRVYVTKQCSTSGERQAYTEAASAALCCALRERYGACYKLLQCSSSGDSNSSSTTSSARGPRQPEAAEAAVELRSVAAAMLQQHHHQGKILLSYSSNGNASSEDAAAGAEAPLGDVTS